MVHACYKHIISYLVNLVGILDNIHLAEVRVDKHNDICRKWMCA